MVRYLFVYEIVFVYEHYVFLDLQEGIHFIQIREIGYEAIEHDVWIDDRGEEFISAISKLILVNITYKKELYLL